MTKMKTLFYAPIGNECAADLLKRVRAFIPKKHLHFSNDAQSFERDLLSFRTENPVVMIYVSTIDDLQHNHTLKELLDDIFLIVVTDSGKQEVREYCRRLYPRIFFHADDDLDIISAVIEKRLKRFAKPKRRMDVWF